MCVVKAFVFVDDKLSLVEWASGLNKIQADNYVQRLNEAKKFDKIEISC